MLTKSVTVAKGVKRGREFLKVAREISKHKPIVLVKSGRTKAGVKAAKSHTGSLSSREEIFNAACRQCGIVRAEDFEEAIDYVKSFSLLPLPKSDSVGVASYSGAGCVIAADAIEYSGLKLASLNRDTYEKIASIAPPYWPKSNPIDLGPILESKDAKTNVSKVLDYIFRDETVNLALLVLPVVGRDEEAILWEEANIPWYKEELLKLKGKHPTKPFIVVANGSKKAIEELKESLEPHGIPVFTSILRGVRALAKLCQWSRRRGLS